MIDKSILEFTEEVKNALEKNQSIVALESTLISFGLPYPENLETAVECEEILRKIGVTPATIWIGDGKIRIGATRDDLINLAKAKDIIKTNLSNISIVLSKKKTGATTVSASILSAGLAGISIFATGGIGGVHRDFQQTFDVSSDLTSLANQSMIVVSSGVKSLLNIRATVEYLETLGIPVIGYQTKTFPGFYYIDSGLPVDTSVESAEEVIEIFKMHKALFKNGSVLVVVPCPEKDALPADMVEWAIKEAEDEMKRHFQDKDYFSGREVTPFILKKLSELTQGKSLKANISLIKNNVFVAGKIALAYSHINSIREPK